MGLGIINVLAGNFKVGNRHQYVHGKLVMKMEGKFLRERILPSEIETLELASEEAVVSLGGAAGWGLTGDILLGPVGLLAGLVLGGKGKDVTFIVKFKDGRKFLGTASSKVFYELQKKVLVSSFHEGGASVRPASGTVPAKKSHPVLKVFVWSIGILFLLGIIAEFIEKPKTTQQEGTTSSTNGYILKPKESAILEYLLKDEVTAFSKGGDSLLSREILSVSVADVAKAYNDNQVAADQKYLKKTVRLTGNIESIDGEPYGEWSISMVGLPSQTSLVRFQKAYWEIIQTLHRGDKLVLVCDSAGAVAGFFPEFDSCVFAGDYANQKITEIRKQIDDFLSGEEPKSKKIAKLVVIAIATARSLPDNSSCFSGGDKCASELKAFQTKQALEKNVPPVLKELKADGVKMPAKEDAPASSR